MSETASGPTRRTGPSSTESKGPFHNIDVCVLCTLHSFTDSSIIFFKNGLSSNYFIGSDINDLFLVISITNIK